MAQKDLEKALQSMRFQHYVNSREVLNVGGASLAMEDILKATLISELNVMLVGETGEGKTQLEKDILGLFGNQGLFVLGRNDMRVRDLFQMMDLEAFHSGEAKTSEELVRLTTAVDFPLVIVDELTRCIPEVQNQLFNVFDGYVEINGKVHKLGAGTYHIGIASGNVGNGRYIGASDTDRALLDRMHLIIDVDNFSPTPYDTMRIVTGSKDPRVKDAEALDAAEGIRALNSSLTGDALPLMAVMAAMHLVHGLDYLPEELGGSKRRIKNVWPNPPKATAYKGGDELVVFPVSKRAAITYLSFTEALGLVAQGKGAAAGDIDYLHLFFDAFKLAGAYSGILNPAVVKSEHFGNPYDCMDAVVNGIESEFKAKEDLMATALLQARKGELDESVLGEFTGRFGYVKDFVGYLAQEASQGTAPDPRDAGMQMLAPDDAEGKGKGKGKKPKRG